MTMKRSSDIMHLEGCALPQSDAKRSCHQEDLFFFKLPTQQQQQELGTFWISSAQPQALIQQQQQAPCVTCSQVSWQEDLQGLSMSISLAAHHCHGTPCAEAEDSDVQDTASSGGSMRSDGSSQRQRLALAAPACAPAQAACARSCTGHAAGEDDSITSEQRPMGTNAGTAGKVTVNYTCAGFDVSSLYCWEVLQNVLEDI